MIRKKKTVEENAESWSFSLNSCLNMINEEAIMYSIKSASLKQKKRLKNDFSRTNLRQMLFSIRTILNDRIFSFFQMRLRDQHFFQKQLLPPEMQVYQSFNQLNNLNRKNLFSDSRTSLTKKKINRRSRVLFERNNQK